MLNKLKSLMWGVTAVFVVLSVATAVNAASPADGAHTHPGYEARITALEGRITALEARSVTPAPTPSPSPTPPPTASPAPTQSPTSTPVPTATGLFTVSGPNILDPSGSRFVVKGMTPIYGPFAGGDYNGVQSTYSLNNNAAIFSQLKTQWVGVNTVRIFTSGSAANGTAPADWNNPDYRNKLWPVIANARAQGFVVIIANSYSNIPDTNAWVTELADRYKGDPYVWITPSNEPFCTSPDSNEKSGCTGGTSEWSFWRSRTQAQVDLVRSRGFHNPILLNGPNWSWYWNGYTNYTINDPDHALIFGVHRYANSNSWSTAELNNVNTSWGNLSVSMPIVADEIGNYNGGGQNTSWYQGMTDFLAGWVNSRGGAGAIAFNHYWSDANGQTTNGVTKNAWGTWWYTHYISVVH